ncbi:MAG TPA: hypothetical protein VE133_18310, partial [Candidatus Sulfotelmatobacter sp.]|nr:hypothetical protein [Candidatus Sulfotelmatobacter sp.]
MGVVIGAGGFGRAQQSANAASAADAKNTTDMLNAIDELTEQNRRLERQNQQLIGQITALRQTLLANSGLEELPLVFVGSSGNAGTAKAVPSSAQTASPNSHSRAQNQASSQDPNQPYRKPELSEPEMWGEWNPGQGFTVAETERGRLSLSGYMVARYLNQLPAEQTAVDHLGRSIPVQPRQDFQFHRVMLYASGWFLDPKFKYFTFVWTVNDTAQVAVGGSLTYEFNKRFWLGMGINPLPVGRSVQGNHPYWPSYDRMMADEFFRPFFTQGFFGGGELPHKLFYKWMTGNNLSTLGVRATQLTRELNFGASLTWMPTTGEFGPRGAFGDFEDHEKLATRFGIGYGVSRENRQSNENDPANNTTIRLADSLNVFDPGALADGVTVQKVTW